MTIAIVGIGLIGGSMAIDLRKRGFADKIIGVDNNIQHQNIALLCGIVDATDTLEVHLWIQIAYCFYRYST